MNWSNLPNHIIEKIIKFTYKCYCCDKNLYEEKENSWIIRLHKYGQVCSSWKNVIFNSKTLFAEEKKTSGNGDVGKRTMKLTLRTSQEGPYWYDEPTEQKLRQMIKDGYLELTTHMTLHGFGEDYDGETLRLIREFAGKSSIKSYTVHTWNEERYCYDTESDEDEESFEDYRSADNFSLFIEVLKESKKAERVCFVMDITDRHDFEIFWDTFVAVLQIKSIKQIRFDLTPCGPCGFARDDLDLISVYPDVLLDHVDKIEVSIEIDGMAEDLFTYDQSDELKMSDFAKNLQGAYQIR